MPREPRSPGPAHYAMPEWTGIAVSPPRSHRGFNRYPYESAWSQNRTERESMILDGKGDPGAYDRSGNDLATVSRRSFNTDSANARSSFASRSAARPRSAPPRSARRGPGEYGRRGGSRTCAGGLTIRGCPVTPRCLPVPSCMQHRGMQHDTSLPTTK